MTVVSGSIAAVDMEPTNGTLTAWSERLRPGGTVMVTSERRQVPIVEGFFEVGLIPGPTEMVIAASGINHPLTVNVPSDVDEVDFQELVGAEHSWEPEVVQAAQQAAAESRRQADRSKQFRDESEALYGDLSAVQQARDDSTAAASAAATSESNAAASESNAAASEEAAATSEGNASSSAAAALSSRNAAASSESNAADSAELAGQHAAQTTADVATSLEHRIATGNARNVAGTYRDQAQAAQEAAESAQDGAETAQAGAVQAVSDASAQIVADTQGHATAAATSASNASSSASQARQDRILAEQAREGAEDIALGAIPGATTAAKGLVQLSGDLSGTAEAPTVPGLSLAAPGAHLCLRAPESPGWAYAEAPAASNDQGWVFDGEFLTPSVAVKSARVTASWCGESSVDVRGRRRSDGTVVTLAQVPSGTALVHREVSFDVDFETYSAISAAATWTSGDLESGCDVILAVHPWQSSSVAMSSVTGLESALAAERSRVDDELARRVERSVLSSSATAGTVVQRRSNGASFDVVAPSADAHPATKKYVDDGLSASASDVTELANRVDDRPAMWLWDGLSEWVAPPGATTGDSVLNLDEGTIHSIEEDSDE